MNINITLCVQSLNFFVMYIFLRYVLFKPIIKIIRAEEKQYAQIQYEINQQEIAINENFHLRQLHWQEFQTHCQFNKPKLENSGDVTKDLPVVLPVMNVDTICIQKMSTKYADIIVNHLKQKDS